MTVSRTAWAVVRVSCLHAGANQLPQSASKQPCAQSAHGPAPNLVQNLALPLRPCKLMSLGHLQIPYLACLAHMSATCICTINRYLLPQDPTCMIRWSMSIVNMRRSMCWTASSGVGHSCAAADQIRRVGVSEARPSPCMDSAGQWGQLLPCRQTTVFTSSASWYQHSCTAHRMTDSCPDSFARWRARAD